MVPYIYIYYMYIYIRLSGEVGQVRALPMGVPHARVASWSKPNRNCPGHVARFLRTMDDHGATLRDLLLS